MTHDPHFKIVKSKIAYENPFMKVHEKDVIYPDGKKRSYWVLDRLANFSIVIPVFSNNTTVLVGQYRVPTEIFSWEFPMGSVKGAEPLETAKTELLQETGLKAKSWQKIGEYFVANGHTNQEAHVFIAKNLEEGESQPEEEEFLKTKRVSIAEVKEMIYDGTIKDGPTIVAFHYLEKYL